MAIEFEDDLEEVGEDENIALPAESGDDDELVIAPDTPDKKRAGGSIEDEYEEDYSSRVKKRISKEVGKRKGAEERANRLEAELNALRSDVQAMQSRNAHADQVAAESGLKSKLADTRQRLKQAVQDGDDDAQIALTEQLADITYHIREYERAKATPAQQQGQEQPQLPRGTRQWLSENSWYNDPQYRRAAMVAADIDAQLQREGYRPSDPEMYEELTNRLLDEMPKMRSVIGAGTAQPARKRDGGPPVGASTPDGTARRPSSARRQFTAADREAMQQFNLKDTPENRKIWLDTHPTSAQ